MRLHLFAGVCLTAALFSTSAMASNKHHKHDYRHDYHRHDLNRDGYICPKERRNGRYHHTTPVNHHGRHAKHKDRRSGRYKRQSGRYSDGYVSADIRPYGINRIQVVFPW